MKIEARCQSLLIISFLSVFFSHATGDQCARGLRKCKDGSCVSRTKNCPGQCDSVLHKLCKNGDCVRKYRQRCPGECHDFEKKCKNGKCVSSWERCPEECGRWEKKCPDGSCISSRLQCPGECGRWEKKCPDGTCITKGYRCPGECDYDEKKCPDGSCANRYRERCLNEACPSGRPLKCSGSSLKCYSESDKCDGSSDCPGGADEENCNSFSLEGWWYFLLIPVATFICILMCIYKCCKYEGASHNMSSSATTRTFYSESNMRPVVGGSGPPLGPVNAHEDETNSYTEHYTQFSQYGRRTGEAQEGLLSGGATNTGRTVPSAPVPGAPPAYDAVVSSDQYSIPADKQGLPTYEDAVIDNPPRK